MSVIAKCDSCGVESDRCIEKITVTSKRYGEPYVATFHRHDVDLCGKCSADLLRGFQALEDKLYWSTCSAAK